MTLPHSLSPLDTEKNNDLRKDGDFQHTPPFSKVSPKLPTTTNMKSDPLGVISKRKENTFFKKKKTKQNLRFFPFHQIPVSNACLGIQKMHGVPVVHSSMSIPIIIMLMSLLNAS